MYQTTYQVPIHTRYRNGFPTQSQGERVHAEYELHNPGTLHPLFHKLQISPLGAPWVSLCSPLAIDIAERAWIWCGITLRSTARIGLRGPLAVDIA